MRPIHNITRFALVAMALAGASVTFQALAKAPPAPTNIDVNWTNPDDFSDRQDSIGAAVDRLHPEAWLNDLAKHLRRRAARVIAGNEHLDVTFTDVNRAGNYEPWRGPSFDDIRIVTDLYPPRIDLRFTLTSADGTTIASGTRKLRDPSFLTRGSVIDSDPLRYEKRMLDDWLRREFPQRQAARN